MKNGRNFLIPFLNSKIWIAKIFVELVNRNNRTKPFILFHKQKVLHHRVKLFESIRFYIQEYFVVYFHERNFILSSRNLTLFYFVNEMGFYIIYIHWKSTTSWSYKWKKQSFFKKLAKCLTKWHKIFLWPCCTHK